MSLPTVSGFLALLLLAAAHHTSRFCTGSAWLCLSWSVQSLTVLLMQSTAVQSLGSTAQGAGDVF